MTRRLVFLLGVLALSAHTLSMQGLAQSVPPGQGSPSSNAIRLSVKDAEALALKNNPAISVARLTALASGQVTREVLSNLWPQAYGNLTAVDAHANSRITAGMLNNPSVYTRAAGRRHGQPTHHRFRAHHQPGSQRPPSGASRRTERGRYERRCFVGRGPGLLQQPTNARCAAGSRADRSLAPVVGGSGFCTHQEQIKVRPGPELCQRESRAGKASLP